VGAATGMPVLLRFAGTFGSRATSIGGVAVSTTHSARGQTAYIPLAPVPDDVAAGVAADGVGKAFTFGGEAALD
jgi:hypothetical protein